MQMEAAILWGLTPSQWLAAPGMDRAIMFAHYRERNMRKSMIEKILHDAAGRKEKPARPTPEHDAFFAGSGVPTRPVGCS